MPHDTPHNTPGDLFEIRLDLPSAAVAEERAAAGPGYTLGAESPLPPDPDAVEARFVDPVSMVAVVTLAFLTWRIVNHFLLRDGRGVMVDARQQPPVVSRLEDVPQGFVVLVKPDGTTEAIDAGKTDDAALAGLLGPVLGAKA